MTDVSLSWSRLTPSAPATATIVRGTVLLSSVLIAVKVYYLGVDPSSGELRSTGSVC